jgi:hypothetical protein
VIPDQQSKVLPLQFIFEGRVTKFHEPQPL